MNLVSKFIILPLSMVVFLPLLSAEPSEVTPEAYCSETFRSPTEAIDAPEPVVMVPFELNLSDVDSQRIASYSSHSRLALQNLTKAFEDTIALPDDFFELLAEGLQHHAYSPNDRPNLVARVLRSLFSSVDKSNELFEARRRLLDDVLNQTGLSISKESYDYILVLLVTYPIVSNYPDLAVKTVEERTQNFISKHLTKVAKIAILNYSIERGGLQFNSGEEITPDYPRRLLLKVVKLSHYQEFYLKAFNHFTLGRHSATADKARQRLTFSDWDLLLQKLDDKFHEIYSDPMLPKHVQDYLRHALGLISTQKRVKIDVESDLLRLLRNEASKLNASVPRSQNLSSAPTPRQSRSMILPSDEKVVPMRPIREKKNKQDRSEEPKEKVESPLTELEVRNMSVEEKLPFVEAASLTADFYTDFLAWQKNADEAHFLTTLDAIVLLQKGSPIREMRVVKPLVYSGIYEIKITGSADRVYFGLGRGGFKLLIMGEGVKRRGRTYENNKVQQARDLWNSYLSKIK